MRVSKSGLARRAYFWTLGSPLLSSYVIVFPYQASPKMGTHVAKTDALQRVHFQATNVNAISVPSGRIVRRPTRIDTSMQSVDASCTASNNSRKLPVTVVITVIAQCCAKSDIFVGTISGARKGENFAIVLRGASTVAISVFCNLKNVLRKKRGWLLRSRSSSQFYGRGGPKIGSARRP